MTEPGAAHHEAMALGMAIAHWATERPDEPAVVTPTLTLTFAQLNARANQLVRALRAAGLRVGDAVALFCTNRTEFVETYAACLRGGFRITPVNSHFTPDEAAYVIGDCGARAVVCDGRLGSVAQDAVRAVKPAPELGLWLDAGDGVVPAGFVDYEAALDAQPDDDIDDPTPGTAMLYTSGTTGRPKGVHKARQSPVVDNLSGYARGSRHLVTGPLYHAAPYYLSMHGPLSNGATVVVMDHFDAATALDVMARERVTHTHVVPIMFRRFLDLPPDRRAAFDPSALRLVIHGAAPCPVPVKQAMIDWWGPVIVEYYASTEGAGSLVLSHDWLARPGTVGKPAPGHVVIGDDDAQPLPPGTAGMVWLRTASEVERFEYFGDDTKTAGAFRGEYYTLGDIGYLDDDGWLFLTDRSAHLIISGGVNIYPAEVDAVLATHPAVADVATIGVPDDEWGESVLAIVELHVESSGSPALAAELIAYCRDRLAHYKCPRAVEFVESLPRTPAGKIQKAKLRAERRT